MYWQICGVIPLQQYKIQTTGNLQVFFWKEDKEQSTILVQQN